MNLRQKLFYNPFQDVSKKLKLSYKNIEFPTTCHSETLQPPTHSPPHTPVCTIDVSCKQNRHVRLPLVEQLLTILMESFSHLTAHTRAEPNLSYHSNLISPLSYKSHSRLSAHTRVETNLAFKSGQSTLIQLSLSFDCAQESSTSFPGSFLSREKDPGWVWSRGNCILSTNK